MKYFITLSLIIFISFSLSGQEKDLIEWKTVQQADSLQLKGDKRLLFMDVYTDWCGPCKLMDKNTFHNEAVAEYINETFIPVKFNAESKEEVSFKGKSFSWIQSGRKGIHSFAYYILAGELRYPSMPIVSNKGELITVITGYFQPEEFLTVIKDVKSQIDQHMAKELQ